MFRLHVSEDFTHFTCKINIKRQKKNTFRDIKKPGKILFPSCLSYEVGFAIKLYEPNGFKLTANKRDCCQVGAETASKNVLRASG